MPFFWGTLTLSLLLLVLSERAGAAPSPAAQATEALPPHSFTIPAWAFDRGNARTFTQQWANAGPMIAFGGESPVAVEYDLEFPLTADYRLDLRYAAAESRPVSLSLNGQTLTNVCRDATGSWNTSGAAWENSASFRLGAGRHTLRFERQGNFPHLMTLRLTASQSLPEGWAVHRPNARKLSAPPPPRTIQLFEPPTNLPALRRAIEDLSLQFGDRYAGADGYLARLAALESAHAAGRNIRQEFLALQREALLANPLLDFDELLLIRRPAQSPSLGLPRNWESNCSLPASGYDDALCHWSLRDPNAEPIPLHHSGGKFMGDVDLHWDADRVLFSMPDSQGRWQVFEMNLAHPEVPRPLTGEQPDVDSYDACYLPNGRIAFTSTASFVGVPCVNGSAHVANLYVMDADGRHIRQLGFDQEHNWCPSVMNDGRLLYARWEYTDTPHSNTRLLFTMNPDGTSQSAYLGNSSYWPNSFFYARAIPDHPTKVVAIIGGHHDHPRMGELVVFDPQQGRHEDQPAVQRIPGYGKKVEAIIRDGLTLDSWPKFLHPWPLSEHYFLVASQPAPRAPWGLYLVDVFDNLLPLIQQPGVALLEPIPWRRMPRPPILPDRVDPNRTDALVVLQDIYAGEGLRGVPRGTVKSLRLITYHYAYQGMGGLLGVVGMDGPWDIKRVLGTVPVEPDGSARFRVPANTPISLQPLDAEGKALQLMRSWMTAMPGETVQCTGCHDRPNTAPPVQSFLALQKPPSDIAPWHGPVRGFSYAREVQPVIDQHCVRCHQGQAQPDGRHLEDLRGTEHLTNWSSITPGNGGYTQTAGKFSVGYANLHRYVRRPGIESEFHVLEPLEFHADTTHLVQLLAQGHHGVQLDTEDWDRLVTWIDLNCPYHGTWGEEIASPGPQRERRRDLLKRYANLDDDPEAVPPTLSRRSRREETLTSPEASLVTSAPTNSLASSWPFDRAEAIRRQAAAGSEIRRQVELAPGLQLELMLIPAGEFQMGNHDPGSLGQSDCSPPRPVRVAQAFWMACLEINNAQFACYDPDHDSRVEDKNAYQFGIHGYPANLPELPVVRVSWEEAMAFCDWLSARTGRRFTLPTEAQWEWACRAGAATPFSFGDFNTDFSGQANFADAKLREFASDPYTVDKPLANPTPFDDWIPKDARFNDGALIAVAPGGYAPNAWGLHDMHGNVSEWTRSDFMSFTGREADAHAAQRPSRRVVRGGSWRDVPARGTASFRLGYQPWQRIFNVGFRVVCELDGNPSHPTNTIRQASLKQP